MQRKRSVALVATLVAAVAGCDDGFLDETPYDFVGPENFYRTAGDAVAAVNAAYSALGPGTGGDYYGRNFVMLVEYPTEALTTRYSSTHERARLDNYSVNTDHSYIRSTWSAAYEGIKRANAVIRYVPEMQINTGLRERVVAEAKFLRAVNYFNLVRLFGGVPLYTDLVNPGDELNRPRAPAAEVYAQIVKDLTEAEAVLPLASAYAAGEKGRATRGAAQGLLAKVLVHRAAVGVGQPADNAQAAEWARRVIQSNQYSLLPSYGRVYAIDNENNAEILFDVQNLRQPGLGNDLSAHQAPRNSSWATNQWSSFHAELPFLQSYDPRDTRRNATWVLEYVDRNGKPVRYDPGAPGSRPSSAVRSAYGQDAPTPFKNLDPEAGTGGAGGANFIILRYADVLLTLAEAINETAGPTPEAIGAVNQVRVRAGLPPLSSSETAGKAAFKDAIFRERRYELVMEGHGFFDNQRHWDWAVARVRENMLQFDSLGRVRWVPSLVNPITDRHRLMPIPQRALDINKKLEQNPGW